MVSRYTRSPSAADMKQELKDRGLRPPFEAILFLARFVAEPAFNPDTVLCGRSWLLMQQDQDSQVLITSSREDAPVNIDILEPRDIRYQLSFEPKWLQDARHSIDSFDLPTTEAGIVRITFRDEVDIEPLEISLGANPKVWEHVGRIIFGWTDEPPT